MALTIPDYDDSLEDIKNDLLTEWPGADTADGSDHDSWARVESNLLEGAHARLAEVEKQILPTTCDADRLDEFGEAYNHPQGDDETDEEYRERIVALIQQPIASGKDEDYEKWAKAGGKDDDGNQVVTDVLVLSVRGGEDDTHRGVGCVDVIVLQDGSDTDRIITDADVLSNVEDYIDLQKPAGADVVVWSASNVPQNVKGVVYFSSDEYKFDFDGYRTVVAGSTDTTIIADDTTGLQAGKRVVISNEMREIDTVVNGAEFTLTEALPIAPNAGLPIGAGGPSWEALLAAVQAYFDGIMPLGSIYRSKIASAMLTVSGTDGVDVSNPAAEETTQPDTNTALAPMLYTLGRLELENG